MYPAVNAPYGLKPINLIGGQQFAGGVRHLPIGYGNPNSIFNGDFVKLAANGAASGAGLVGRAAVLGAATKNQVTGVAVGVSYTNPGSKQKYFGQYWPGGTLAGDGECYVVDDPDTIFKAVALVSAGVVGSVAYGSIGANIACVNGGGNPATGNSLNGLLSGSENTGVLPLRVVGLVQETSIPVVATGSSAALVVTLTNPGGLPRALPIGTDVAWLAPNGQIIRTGSMVAAPALAGATVVNVNTAPAAAGVATPIPAASTIIFTIFPEALVKINATVHGYTSDTAV